MADTLDHRCRSIHMAVSSCHIDCVQLHIDRGSDPNMRCHPFNDTMLIVASRRKAVDIIKILLKAGANMHLENRSGVSAFKFVRANKSELKEIYEIMMCHETLGYNTKRASH